MDCAIAMVIRALEFRLKILQIKKLLLKLVSFNAFINFQVRRPRAVDGLISVPGFKLYPREFMEEYR